MPDSGSELTPNLRGLYPACEPEASGHLDVGQGHRVWFERCGTRGALPVVFLHGGPGSGCKADHRQFFDPSRYDIVLLDQRGSGRSTPFGSVQDNDTFALVDDLEALREHLGIEQWVLFGGSWGATLGLAYAQKIPSRTLGMVLRGSFLARRRDVDWFYHEGASRLLPVQWHAFLERIGDRGNARMAEFLYRGVFSDDRAQVERIAHAWDAWSGAVVMFSINQASGDGGSAGDVAKAVARTRIEMHYARHAYFLTENQLLDEAHRLPKVPVKLVHGARDLTCPAEAAWALHRAISGSTLEILRTAGHLSGEKPMIDALVRASDELANTLAGT